MAVMVAIGMHWPACMPGRSSMRKEKLCFIVKGIKTGKQIRRKAGEPEYTSGFV